ncbi:hypothetical protein IW261DRAFT_1626576 [Armillaria novae-zelandiae]|uniref:F-box domain-containing protein n=1 Tax=Armillaria novae-zelandiae TaxID=153914 RepID=A0AA39P8C7_9AGAR|nr:hypothetical protein IW261DRAFT_1626576 [Armillaria novae-zelandiae]
MPTHDYCPTCGTTNLRVGTVPTLHTPRIEQLISINEPPLELEEAPLRDIVNQGPQMLTDLDAKIADVKDTLQQLLRERSQVADNLSIAKNILHPIRRRPTDVLRHIFLACVQSPVECLFSLLRNDSMNLLEGPWHISHVCRRWRSIATNTPRLWLCISLIFPIDASRTLGFTLMLGCYIERSKNLELTLSVNAEDDVSEHAALALLLSTCHRWKDVALVLPSATFRTLSFCRGSFRTLRYLHAGLHDKDGYTLSMDPLLDAFEYSPNLTHISLPITVYDVADGPDDEGITETPHLHVLTKMPLLESMRLYCDKRSTIPASGRVRLPRLQNLTLAEGYTAVAGSLSQCFSALSLPSLTELRLGYANDRNPVQLPSIVYPTRIDAPRITTLQLTFCFEPSPTADDSILIFLADLPTVMHLMVQAEAITDGLIEGLIRRHGILPSLRYLDIRGSALDLDEPELFINMLESRLTPSTSNAVTNSVTFSTRECLRELRLNEGFTIGETYRQRWNNLSERGLIVRHRAGGLGDSFDHIALHGRDDLLFHGMPWIP